MPGFSEYSRHNTEFNEKLSQRKIRKRELDNLACIYLESLGLRPYYVKYTIKGDIMSFNYNRGNMAFKRIVYLSTRQFMDVPLRINRNYNIAYDVNTNTFYIKS